MQGGSASKAGKSLSCFLPLSGARVGVHAYCVQTLKTSTVSIRRKRAHTLPAEIRFSLAIHAAVRSFDEDFSEAPFLPIHSDSTQRRRYAHNMVIVAGHDSWVVRVLPVAAQNPLAKTLTAPLAVDRRVLDDSEFMQTNSFKFRESGYPMKRSTFQRQKHEEVCAGIFGCSTAL
jgi:hypothetical protein